MDAHDRERFAGILASLSLIFGRDLDRTTAEVYFRALADLSIAEVSDGAECCIRELTYFPKPGEIRSRAFRGSGEAEHQTHRPQLPPANRMQVNQAGLDRVREIIDQASVKSCPVPWAGKEPEQNPPPPRPVPFIMTEPNWRARWDMGKIHPDLLFLRNAIPERLRIQFAAEDAHDQ